MHDKRQRQLTLSHQSRLDQLSLNIISGSRSNTSDREIVVRRAHSEKNDVPSPTKSEDSKQMGRGDGEKDDPGIVVHLAVGLFRAAQSKVR